jgi:hypothetical protein
LRAVRAKIDLPNAEEYDLYLLLDLTFLPNDNPAEDVISKLT